MKRLPEISLDRRLPILLLRPSHTCSCFCRTRIQDILQYPALPGPIMSRRFFNPMFQMTRSLRESGVNAGQSGARLSEHLTHRDPRPEHKKLLREARKDPELYVCRVSKLCLLFFSSTNIFIMLPGSLHPYGSYSRRLWMVPTPFLGSHHWRDQSL